MLKSELYTQLINQFPLLPQPIVKKNLDLILKILANSLTQGQRIEIRGFGTFSFKYNAPRIAYNPKKGGRFIVPSKYRIHFKMGSELKKKLNLKN